MAKKPRLSLPNKPEQPKPNQPANPNEAKRITKRDGNYTKPVRLQ